VQGDDEAEAEECFVSEPEPVVVKQESVSGKSIETVWPEFMDLLSKERPSLSAFLSQAQVVSGTNSSVDLKFSSGCGFPYREVMKRQNLDDLKRLLCQFSGTVVEINITLDTSVPENQEQSYFTNQPRVSSNINDEIEREPIIKNILEIFDGEIVS
ncbi:MAG: hypothetical protein Q4F84_01220, partial [Fibrobacter sp.]|nr:hypothetical protein [Fibrobacter sp.]